ncbi:MAG: hypothetical protein ACT4NU_04220 [Chromatiales bacterium]
MQRARNAAAQKWFGDTPDSLVALQWHTETFTLPQEAVPLLSSAHCAKQAFVLGGSLALQAHIEVTEEVVTRWLARFGHEIAPTSGSVQSPEAVLRGMREHLPASLDLAERIYSRWMKQL